ncbi:MAG: prolipoprotein diacylglyceryl transferase [Candidatus Omnitrophica bacterium]|nr:prolipoprotein diacylglyceryl transferase [Candidatus Omnitrophota bacterium]
MHKILFHIGPFEVYTYGFFVATAFIAAMFLIKLDAERRKMRPEIFMDILLFILVTGLIGSRLLYVIINYDYFKVNPARIFAFRDGGLSIQGGIVFAALTSILFAKFRKISYFKAADFIVPYVALGQGIGRVGCFFNGCCYGKIIAGGIGVTFPGESCMRIPIQLYSAAFLLLTFVLLLLYRDQSKKEGAVFLAYLMLYSAGRSVLDLFRGDNPVIAAGMTLSQLISMGVLVVSVLIWMRFFVDGKHQ